MEDTKRISYEFLRGQRVMIGWIREKLHEGVDIKDILMTLEELLEKRLEELESSKVADR